MGDEQAASLRRGVGWRGQKAWRRAALIGLGLAAAPLAAHAECWTLHLPAHAKPRIASRPQPLVRVRRIRIGPPMTFRDEARTICEVERPIPEYLTIVETPPVASEIARYGPELIPEAPIPPSRPAYWTGPRPEFHRPPAPVPEPGTWMMMIAGTAMCGSAIRLRKSRPQAGSTSS